MALWGTLVNFAAIIIGSLLGKMLPSIPERVRVTVMQGLGICIVVLGLTMALKTENFLLLIISLVIGGVIGELLRIDHHLERLGQWLERTVNRVMGGNGGTGGIAEGFVTATLVYCIGAMAILGSIDSGLRHNHDILYTKSMLDGISAVIFASTLGIGVLFSAFPVLLYQGVIALGATLITSLVSESLLSAIILEVTAVGGVLIIGIGLNILKLLKVNVANQLPALLVAVIEVLIMH